MADKPDVWMPIFWGDYARDTGHLSAAHHGAYLMLIKHYWVTGVALPDDDGQLWRIACTDGLAHWRKLRTVIAGFFEVSGGVWKHARVEREMMLATKRQEKAKHAASKRWASNEHAPMRDAPSMPEHCPDDAIHNSSSQSQSSEAKASGGQPPTARERIFREYLPWIMEKLDKNREHCATQMGVLVRDAGGDYDIALTALSAAREVDAANPFTYAKGCLKPRETFDQRRIREGMEVINAYEAEHDRH